MAAGNKPSSISSLVVASVGAATLAISLWMYHHNSKKSRTSNIASGDSVIDDDAQKSKKDDVLHREIDIDGSTADGLGRILSKGTITIAYCSTTGTCEGFAKKLHKEILDRSARNYKLVQLIQVAEVDWWDELLNNEGEADDSGSGGPPVLLFILPTWTDGTLPPNSQNLLQSLSEISTDWRVAPEPLRSRRAR